MPYYTSIGMKDGNIMSSDINTFNGEVPCPILIHCTKNGVDASVMVTDEFFVEEKHRGDSLSNCLCSGEVDEIHSLTIMGHTKKAVANMKQLIAIGMRFSTLYMPHPSTLKSDEPDNTEFTE